MYYKLFFSVLALLSISVLIPFFESFGEHESHPNWRPYPTSHPSLPVVDLQLTLRDSNGSLIAYSEPSTVFISNIVAAHQLLDDKNGTIFTHDGNDYELVEFAGCSNFKGIPRQFATYQTGYKGDIAFIWRHDGYIAGEGDQYCVSIKVIRDLSLRP